MAENDAPEITLVQYPGLTGKTTLSAPCGKAHMALAFKGLSYNIRNVNTPAQVRRYNPRGRVPVLLVDGEAVIDSTDIVSYLESRFPDPPLEPADPTLRAQAKVYEDWADEVIYFYGVFMRWCTEKNYALMRERVLGRLPIPMRWIVPLIAQRELKRRVRGQGVGLKGEQVVRREIGECFRTLAALLTGRSFLVGESFTRADLAVGAMIDQLRLEQLTPDLAAEIAAIPEIVAWNDRIHEIVPNAARPAGE